MLRQSLRAVLAFVVVGFGATSAFSQPPAKPVIKVDPVLISQLDQVWTIVGGPKNPVWPGWDARDTPVLIYFPDRQDVLINHPKPPDGFRRYEGPIKSSLGPIFVRDGKTVTSLDGQNTAVDVGGVRTLMVADTLSTPATVGRVGGCSEGRPSRRQGTALTVA